MTFTLSLHVVGRRNVLGQPNRCGGKLLPRQRLVKSDAVNRALTLWQIFFYLSFTGFRLGLLRCFNSFFLRWKPLRSARFEANTAEGAQSRRVSYSGRVKGQAQCLKSARKSREKLRTFFFLEGFMCHLLFILF